MVPLGRTSLTALLPVSATKTSPAASTATPCGLTEPGADGQDGAVGQDLLDGVVAGVGDEDVAGRVHRHAGRRLNPEPMVVMVPSGRTSLTALLPVSATKTSPAASTATPIGLAEPGADGGGDGGRERGVGGVLEQSGGGRAFGLTVALSVAPVAETETAASVVTDGGRGRVVNDCGGLCMSATVPPALEATTR